MPMSAADLAELLADVKRLASIIEGHKAQAESEEGRVAPAGEPPARTFRLR
jgi:hypothetical protein